MEFVKKWLGRRGVIKVFSTPSREYVLIVTAPLVLAGDFLFPFLRPALITISVLGSLPTLYGALVSGRSMRISIDTFNSLALIVSFVTGEYQSTVFIILMLAFARLLDFHTQSRAHNAV